MNTNKKITTLVMATNQSSILLGYKKRGFGSGRWNGFGGKVEPGESIEEAAVRYQITISYLWVYFKLNLLILPEN